MKLARYGPAGQERPALVDRDGRLRDLSGHVGDICGDTIAPDKSGGAGRAGPGFLASR